MKISKNPISKQFTKFQVTIPIAAQKGLIMWFSKEVKNQWFIAFRVSTLWVMFVMKFLYLLRCDYVSRSTIFFYLSLFNATISQGRLSFKGDHVSRGYGTCLKIESLKLKNGYIFYSLFQDLLNLFTNLIFCLFLYPKVVYGSNDLYSYF